MFASPLSAFLFVNIFPKFCSWSQFSGDHSRLGRVPHKIFQRTLQESLVGDFYRSDALPVIQPTVSEHWTDGMMLWRDVCSWKCGAPESDIELLDVGVNRPWACVACNVAGVLDEGPNSPRAQFAEQLARRAALDRRCDQVTLCLSLHLSVCMSVCLPIHLSVGLSLSRWLLLPCSKHCHCPNILRL